MSADNKTGLALGKASKIGDVITTAGHDAVGEMTNTGDALKEPDVGSVNIEEVAQLAKLCAAGTPSDKDFKAIKERVGVAGYEAGDENDRAHLVPKDWRTSEKAAPSELPRDPNTGRDAFFRQIEIARDKSDFSAGLEAMESSIRVFRRPSSMRGRTSHTIGLFSITALVSLGAIFAWHFHGDEAGEMVKRWSSSIGWPSSVSTNSPPAAAVATPSPEIAQRPQTTAPDAAIAHRSTEQPPAKQGHTQTSPDIEAALNVRSKGLSPPQHVRAKRTPVPETRPTTIDGWMLREVTNGTAVLEGPNGTWTVKRGDTVPGVGRVESIVLWGKRWIVATSKGLISTP
jgi:hypothetical protein